MLKSVAIQICSIVYLVLLLLVFVTKKKNYKLEGAIYQTMLYTTFLVLLFDILCNVWILYKDPNSLQTNIFGKGYLVFSILWCFWLNVYVRNINDLKDYKTLKELFKKEKKFKIGIIITLIMCIVSSILTSTYSLDNTTLMPRHNGQALYFTYIVCFIYMTLTSLHIITNPNNISYAKRIPIFTFLFLGMASIVLQWIIPSLLLTSAVMAFVMLFIYFTMENPDLVIINELEKDKEVVEEASKAKTDFLSNMSHDIRTPMNAIIGFSESLLTEDLSDFQKSEVQNIYEAASTLLEIINNILDVSRIESGKEEKHDKMYDFRKIIMQLTSVITAKIDPEKVKFTIIIDKNVPTHFIGDELKIYQILMNLLSNAVKYTSEGEINFTVTSENLGDQAKVKFEVKDTGIGIKESDYDKIFVKFSRIHNEENYNTIEGTGLGLVITKSLVELLGGQISFTSEYGKGTTFTAVIPQIIYQGEVESEVVSAVTKTANAGNVHFDGSLYDILIVDDNDLNLKVAQRILSDYKFEITLASSGDECISLIESGKRFDLIFLDHMMPGMDGLETLRKMHALQGVKIPPVVALTANAMVGMKEMYLKEGFDGYISKPINRDELQVLLNNFFCKR